LKKYDFFRRFAGDNLFSKKNMSAHLRFVKFHLNKQNDTLSNVLWTDETRVEMFGHNVQQHLISTVKHGGGGMMIWACFANVGLVRLAVFESTTNSSVQQRILESNVRPSV